MDYMKVPELNHALMMLPVSPNDCSTPLPSRRRFFANLINAVYTPTTGLLAQIEDQKRVIEELRGKVSQIGICTWCKWEINKCQCNTDEINQMQFSKDDYRNRA